MAEYGKHSSELYMCHCCCNLSDSRDKVCNQHCSVITLDLLAIAIITYSDTSP